MLRITKKLEKKYDENMIVCFENEVEICSCVSENNRKLIEKLIEKENFKGKDNEILKASFLEGDILISMTYIGVGKKKDFTENKYREVLYKSLKGLKGNILVSSKEEKLLDEKIFTEIVYNINYAFDKYIEKKNENIHVDIFVEKKEKIDNKENEILGEMTNITRKLIDEPANVINPETLALKAESLGKECGFEVEILDEYRISELGMEAFLAVGRASKNRPKLIIMRYMGDPENKNIIGLVGKGLTYDTGGLCLKSPDGMFDMKTDMGGGATVIGAIGAVAKAKLKKNVVAVIAACENGIGSNAYRPGDILKTMNGKTIEVVNTDAEGRITLGDAITYITRMENVSEIIDVATLTGGVMVALGMTTTGLFSNSDKMVEKFIKASENWGEKYWRMPLFEEYGEMIKSDVADIKNSAGRWASSITASKFLENFVENTPWIHLDIAGTAYLDKDGKWFKKGATGVGVKTIYSYIKNI